MGRCCIICCRERPHEEFGGRGERARICRTCRSRPKAEILGIKQRDEIFQYLHQAHISAKNIARLRELAEAADDEIASLADLVLQVAAVKPYKVRRLKVLARQRPDLLARLDETGLILAHHR